MDFDDIAPPDQAVIGLAAPDVGKSLGLEGSPKLGAASGGDTDVIPLVRVNPQYPPRAQSAGVEGRVHLRFTVTPQGTTTDVQVVSAEPPGYFESAAMSAVKKYKYRPRVEGGQPIAKPGVEVVLSFKLKRS
jgi:protein TonB